jgi:hypothetical protein
VSGSLHRLRHNARWWLRNPSGEVKIIILVAVNRKKCKLRNGYLLPWVAIGHLPQNIPTKVQGISINKNIINGAPFILEFHKIFLRPAVPPEGDFRFTAQDLSDFATKFWNGLT